MALYSYQQELLLNDLFTGDISNTTLTQFEDYNGSAWGEIANGSNSQYLALATTTVPSGYLECNGAAVSRLKMQFYLVQYQQHGE